MIAPSHALAEAPAPAAPPTDSSTTADWLNEVWQRVMRDLNTRHKRVHALLRNADPLRLDGETLVLVAAYEFHYKQINQEATRTLIEEALERHAGQHYRVRCVLAGEGEGPGQGPEPPAPAPPVPPASLSAAAPPTPLPALSAVAPPPAPPPSVSPAPAPAKSASDATDDQARLQAAINIFNARLV